MSGRFITNYFTMVCDECKLSVEGGLHDCCQGVRKAETNRKLLTHPSEGSGKVLAQVDPEKEEGAEQMPATQVTCGSMTIKYKR